MSRAAAFPSARKVKVDPYLMPHIISSIGATNDAMLVFKTTATTTNLPYTKENNPRKHTNVASKKLKVAEQARGLTAK